MPLRRQLAHLILAGGLVAASLAVAVVAESPDAQASSGVATINPNGGTNSTDGLKVVYSEGQFQVIRNGQTQLYNDGLLVPGSERFRVMNNQISLAVGDNATGGTVVIPRQGSVGEASNVTEAYWDTYSTTEAVTTSAGVWSFQSVLSKTINSRLYTVTVSASYTEPNDFFDLTFTTNIPAGNDKPVRLYIAFDSYLAGSDRGPGFYNDSKCPGFPVVGVTKSTAQVNQVQGIQYVSGAAWAGYASENYSNAVESRGGYGAGHMTDLNNTIDTDPTVDNGFGVNWNFGSTPGTTRVAARFIFSTTLNAINECPTPAAEPDPDATTPPAVVLPPAVSDLVSQPVTPPTTTTPSTTAPATTAPTTTAPTTTDPTPISVDGALPELEPGERQVLLDGQPVDVEVFVDNSTDLVMQGQDFILRLAGDCRNDCTIDIQDSGRELLTLEEGGRANVSGEGFLVGTPVHIWLFSEPRYLGALTVQADGTFRGQVPLLGVAPGLHTLQVNGTSFDGLPRSANLGVRVLTSDVPTPDQEVLPATGTTATPLWILALTLLGIGLTLTTRRRTTTR